MKKFFSIIISCLIMLIFSSCSFNNIDTDLSSDLQSEGSETVSGSLKVIVNRTDLVEDGTFNRLTESFTQKYPLVNVEYVALLYYAEEIGELILTDDYFGDVIMTPQEIKLADLPTFFSPLGDYKTLSENYLWLDDFTFEGEVYALPHAGVASGILYNKKVWADAGLTELPETPEEFIYDLYQIAEKTDAIPYYTNYSTNWSVTQWQSLVQTVSGDPNYDNSILEDKMDLFYDGSPYDIVYKMMYDIYSAPKLHEQDPYSTDWEGSKIALGTGKIGTMVMGSWAISQIQKAAGANSDDIGYMPFPLKLKDNYYSFTNHDYGVSISKNSKNQTASRAYIEWLVNDSGLSEYEGMLSPVKSNSLPKTLASFKDYDVKLLYSLPVKANLAGKFDEIAKASEVDPWGFGPNNFKFKLAESAFKGMGEDGYKNICDDVNSQWSAVRDNIID